MIFLDTETYSEVPINYGMYRYIESVECMVLSYAFDQGPVKIWDITLDPRMPYDLDYMLDDPDELIVAHNAMFDRNVLKYSLKRNIEIARWRCTMVRAMTHGLPGGLDRLGQIFKLGELSKHKEGRALIHLFCKPRPKNSELRRATRLTHPAEWGRFCGYAGSDITAMRALWDILPEWNYSGEQLAWWFLDQQINDRGIHVDVPFAQAAVEAVDRAKKRLNARTMEITDGALASTSKRDQLLIHLVNAYGVEMPDMQKDTLERRINDPDLPIELRELLENRLQVSQTSASKYTAVVRGAQSDSRIRGTQQYSGAQRTRRTAGRTLQPQNMARPTFSHDEIELGIEAIMGGWEADCWEDVMGLTRNAVRGIITAAPGNKLVVADKANIEGRIGAWTGGEAWKLDAFRAYDAGRGPDLYIVAYAASFNVDTKDVTKPQRQIGKVEELMLQYEGGVGAFITGAETYGIDLDDMTAQVAPTLPREVWTEALEFYEWTIKKKRATFGLPMEVFVTCDSLKRLWRRRHPGIVQTWADLKSAAVDAITQPGRTFEAGMFKLKRDGAWLRLRLPSGAFLCYPSPQVSEKGDISYLGMNQYTKKWSRIKTYGGKLFENICQSLAGDFLKCDMVNAEAAGYPIVLTVHDEIVAETLDDPRFSVDELVEIMSTNPSWAPGIPLAAAGFESYRYRKE